MQAETPWTQALGSRSCLLVGRGLFHRCRRSARAFPQEHLHAFPDAQPSRQLARPAQLGPCSPSVIREGVCCSDSGRELRGGGPLCPLAHSRHLINAWCSKKNPAPASAVGRVPPGRWQILACALRLKQPGGTRLERRSTCSGTGLSAENQVSTGVTRRRRPGPLLTQQNHTPPSLPWGGPHPLPGAPLVPSPHLHPERPIWTLGILGQIPGGPSCQRASLRQASAHRPAR